MSDGLFRSTPSAVCSIPPCCNVMKPSSGIPAACFSFSRTLGASSRGSNAYGHCAAVDANAPLGLHILCRIQNVYMMTTQEHVSLCITVLSCLTNS